MPAATATRPAADEIERREPGRGRGAQSPLEIPPRGWLDVAWRVKGAVTRDRVLLVAAGVAFYGLLAVFPAITALMAVAGLLYEPSELVAALEGVSRIVPSDVAAILLDQARAVAGGAEEGLTLGLVLGLGLALWSASAGVGSLIEGLNVAYGEVEERGFVRLRAMTLLLTLATIAGVLAAAALIVAVPVVLAVMPVAPGVGAAVEALRYVPLALLFVGGVLTLYRVGPCRTPARWRWLIVGALAASALWLAASMGFSLYVRNFASYNETFGSIAGVIVLLTWMWLSAVVVLLGAELNAEIEAQTTRDSTVGPREPMGLRGAVKADRLGRARP